MGAVMRATDWSKTPIGAVETWSPALRMMVGFLLANRFPLLLWWGPQYTSIYNDAYRPILGNKHPKSMGQPVSECWSEIWHILKPLIDTPFNGGPATWMDDIPLEINRHGFAEETHFTIAYSPVPDETAPRGIGGVLATVHEITDKVVGERRVVALRDLGSRSADAKTAEAACAGAAATLANHTKDIPFALLYLIDPDGKRARLAGTAGIGMDAAASPCVIELAGRCSSAVWPLLEAVRSEEMVIVDNLGSRFEYVPRGPWSDPPDSAVVVPVQSNKAHELAGLLVAGVSARLRLDDLYRSFFDLVAAQIATSIANATAYEEERKRAEALAEIDRAKTAFFGNVSHEFRTPLTLMLGPLEDALAGSPDALPQRREDLALVHRNGLRLLKLVNTLLDFSRIEAGRVEASYEPVDLSSYTAELASVFRAAVEKAALKLTVDCPCQGEPVWVDRDMWEKIVLNLLSNAFKFTLSGGITVRLQQKRGSAVLSVTDTGSGIPEHEIPRLFDRFHRVEGARGRTHEGTGIGLALVQELAKLHGGTVRAESVCGKGSTFTVSIPLGTAHLPSVRLHAERTVCSTLLGPQPYVAEALRWLPDGNGGDDAGPGMERPILPEPSLVAPGSPGPRARILLADDNADMRIYVHHLLSARYEVRVVPSGEEALAVLHAEAPPDLLLSDIMMPRMDGYALLRAVRSDPALADLPVVFLSARAGEEASIEGLEAGADDYLVKPFGARELTARVAANLEKAQLRRQRRQAEAEYRRLAAIAENSTDFIGISDTQLRPIYVNEAGRRLVGLDSIDRIRQTDALQYFAPEERARIAREVYPLVVEQGRWRGEATFRHFNTGARIPVLCDVFRIDDPATGGAVNFATVTRDISERKRAEAALRDVNIVLEERVKQRTRELEIAMERRRKVEAALQEARRLEAIGQLTGGIAHDFNNLLTIVIGQTEAITLAAKDDPRIIRMTSAALRAAERAAQLTSQLLAFSGRQHLRLETVELDQLLLEAGDLARRAVGETVTVKVSANPRLWQSRLDPAQFESGYSQFGDQRSRCNAGWRAPDNCGA